MMHIEQVQGFIPVYTVQNSSCKHTKQKVSEETRSLQLMKCHQQVPEITNKCKTATQPWSEKKKRFTAVNSWPQGVWRWMAADRVTAAGKCCLNMSREAEVGCDWLFEFSNRSPGWRFGIIKGPHCRYFTQLLRWFHFISMKTNPIITVNQAVVRTDLEKFFLLMLQKKLWHLRFQSETSFTRNSTRISLFFPQRPFLLFVCRLNLIFWQLRLSVWLSILPSWRIFAPNRSIRRREEEFSHHKPVKKLT